MMARVTSGIWTLHLAPISKSESLDFCAISESERTVVPSSLSVTHTKCFHSYVLLFSFLRWCQWIEERYLSINYVCKLECYYFLQVYWDFSAFCLANNWRQSGRWRNEKNLVWFLFFLVTSKVELTNHRLGTLWVIWISWRNEMNLFGFFSSTIPR